MLHIMPSFCVINVLNIMYNIVLQWGKNYYYIKRLQNIEYLTILKQPIQNITYYFIYILNITYNIVLQTKKNFPEKIYTTCRWTISHTNLARTNKYFQPKPPYVYIIFKWICYWNGVCKICYVTYKLIEKQGNDNCLNL